MRCGAVQPAFICGTNAEKIITQTKDEKTWILFRHCLVGAFVVGRLGSHRLFNTQQQNSETVDILVATLVELSGKHLGALIAVERGTDIGSHTESGTELDCKLSTEVIRAAKIELQ